MDNNIKRNSYSNYEYLPSKLIKKLNDEILSKQGIEYRTKNNFLLCVSLIYYHQVKQNIGLQDYVPLGRNYWKKIYGGDYHEKVLKPLLEVNVVESRDYGYRTVPNKELNTNKGVQKGLVGVRYRINLDLLDDEFLMIQYLGNGTAVSSDKVVSNEGNDFIDEIISDKNFHISINKEKAIGWLLANVDSIVDDYMHPEYFQQELDDMRIEYKEYFHDGHYDTRYGTVKSAKLVAETYGRELFFFKDSIYVADKNEFLEQRKSGLIHHYKKEIHKIGTIPIEDKRSPVTLRIYNHLVNFPSKLLQFININNRTVLQLDLRTSQFLIFANLLNVYTKYGGEKLLEDFKHKNSKTYLKRLIKVLEDHKNLLPKVGVDIHDSTSTQYSNSDVILFIRDVFFNDFYSLVQQELGLKERGFAKHILFKLLFKRSNRSDILTDKLIKRYPTVMSIIAEFKKDDKNVTKKAVDENQDSNFSVFLQCIESEIFIDNILKPLRSNDVPCFSRHDSLVVASGYEDEAEIFAKSVFEKFEFRYNHKVEDKFWDVVDFEELELSGYMDWLIDKDLMNIDAPIEDCYDFPDVEPDKIDAMDEEQKITCEKILEIGIQDDYYGLVDVELLEEITLLPISMVDKNILYDEVVNQRDGFTFFQDATNYLIRKLVFNIQDGLLR